MRFHASPAFAEEPKKWLPRSIRDGSFFRVATNHYPLALAFGLLVGCGHVQRDLGHDRGSAGASAAGDGASEAGDQAVAGTNSGGDGGSSDGGSSDGGSSACAPKASRCDDATHTQSCSTAGGWGSPIACPEGYCNGDGVCGVCGAGDVKCSGNGTSVCSQNGTWGSPLDCPSSTPMCALGKCIGPISCKGDDATCGPTSNVNCCSSNVVPGGTFNRSNDPKSPAKVSDFRLDTFEVSVGRFKKFIAAYSQSMTPAGAGKNPNDPTDTGWDIAWNPKLEPDKASLVAAVQPNIPYVTWTAGNDNLPINGVDWYEAEAFCIWDGARLPTEAEWNYAAAGGSEQRTYPWGEAINSSYAVYGLYGAQVPGSRSPKGDGKWGQADLAGNVYEWVQDWLKVDSMTGLPTYPTPCKDCSQQVVQKYRGARGGDYNSGPPNLESAFRQGYSPDSHLPGFRCARVR